MEEKKVLTLESFCHTDIPGLIDLSASVGWDYDQDEIDTVLGSGRIFGHRNAEGIIVSSAAIIQYEKVASLGMVIVNEQYRGMGLGKEATQQCIDSVPENTTILLIATEEGVPLYENMGFKVVDHVHKYISDGMKGPNPSKLYLDEYKESDLEGVIKVDERAFGDNRRPFLINRIKQSKNCVVVKDEHSHIIGYGMSVLGPVNLIAGPIVAPDHQTAEEIFRKLSSFHQGRVRIDVPAGQDAFRRFLEDQGFTQVNAPPVMALNAVVMPQRNRELYGIAAQIFG
ncbi:GNAT family N-acetyltransferase [Rossellomorea sp. NPDC071047]|uniref:GNAT family N-acetyltransferase n=1 Tax=Rossellomorea sp. NPDC071047 TaxID=3390675 RepID=UPI003D05D6CC